MQSYFNKLKKNLFIIITEQTSGLHLMGYLEFYTDILEELGKYNNGKACLYINKLEDIDEKVLHTLIKASIKRLKETN